MAMLVGKPEKKASKCWNSMLRAQFDAVTMAVQKLTINVEMACE